MSKVGERECRPWPVCSCSQSQDKGQEPEVSQDSLHWPSSRSQPWIGAAAEVGMKTVKPQPHQFSDILHSFLLRLHLQPPCCYQTVSSYRESRKTEIKTGEIKQLTRTRSTISLKIALIAGTGENGAVHAYFGDQQPKILWNFWWKFQCL